MNRDKKFDQWRKRASKRLPDITQKVFALRNTGYTGSGFHWGLEKTLGYCINTISNYWEYPEWTTQIMLKIAFTSLYKDISKINKELSKQGNYLPFYTKIHFCVNK